MDAKRHLQSVAGTAFACMLLCCGTPAPPPDAPAPDVPLSTDGGTAPSVPVAEPDVAADAGVAPAWVPGGGDGPLPSDVLLKTASQTFNRRWQLALRDGRLHVRAQDGASDWRLLGDGLPDGDLPRFGRPTFIDALTADGIHLQVVDDRGVLYRADNLTEDVDGPNFHWTDEWGGAGADGPGLELDMPLHPFGFAVSDSHPLGVASYEDIRGIEHSVGLGVAHLYRLSDDGARLHFNDWWLPPDWSRQVCGPEHGTLRMAALSASASTLFVRTVDGRLFTRLYDLDTSGENDLLTYSFVIVGPSGTTRALPAEPWREHAAPDAPLTTALTILQTGEGNAARTLRIEGIDDDGRVGVFEKGIDDAAWTFVATDGPLLRPLLTPVPTQEARVQPPTTTLQGQLSRGSRSVDVELVDFHLHCSPTSLQFRIDGDVVMADGAPFALQLHTVHKMPDDLDAVRAYDYADRGGDAPVQAALVSPASVHDVDDAAHRARLVELLADKRVVNFKGQASRTAATLVEIGLDEPFMVPLDERVVFEPPIELTLSAP